MEFPNTPIAFPEFNRNHPAAHTPLGLPRPSEVVGPVVFDTESSGLHPDDGSRVSVVSLAYQVDGDPIPRSAAYPFGQGPEDDQQDLGRRAWNHLVRWLASAGGGLVGHNIRFDIHQMGGKSINGYPGRDLIDRVLFDTMVAAAEVWPRGPLALKKIATRLYGHNADEEQRALKPYLGPKTNPRFDLVPWDVMFPYAIRDAELTWAVYYEQQAWLQESTLTGRFVPQEMNIVRCLLRMEQAGLPYDPEASKRYAVQLHEAMEQIQSRVPYDIRPKMLRQYYFGEGKHDLGRGHEVECLGLEPYSTTDSGQPQLTAAVVEKMVKEGQPFARDLQEYNRLKSAISKWYEPFAKRAGSDNRIRTSFRHTGGTKSGRFSATRANLQAVPKDYALHLPVPTPRAVVADAVRAFRPPEGADHWELWDLDLEQAELRLAALDAGCEPMLDHIREGRDPHGETATQLFGVTAEDETWGFYRSIAKRALPLDAPVLTPQGFRPMGEIQVGDEVVGPDGAPTRVLAIPFEGEGEIWEVRTRSGATALCDADHLWNVRRRYGDGYETITTRQLAEEVASDRNRRPSLPLFLDEHTPDRDFPVHPYVLGALLGDGSVPASGQGAPKLHSLKSDRYIADRCGELSGDIIREATRKDRPNMGRYHFLGNRVRTGFRELGVLGVRGKDKRVPEEYFHGSAEQRLELLRGLMDTDGSATKNNHHIFSNTSRGLVDAVVRLVRSLGGVATVNEAYRPPHGKWSPSWSVHVRMPEGRNPYSLPRKGEKWKPNRWTDTVVHAAPTGRREPVKCITVDRPDGLFVTNDYLVTHNCNFSLIFGSGPQTFQTMLANQAGVELPFNDVRKIVYNWRDLYPEFGRAIDRDMAFAEKHAFIEMTTGRPRYYAPGEDRHSAFNQRIQGSLAEFGKRWLISTDEFTRPLRKLGRDVGIGYSGLLLVVHDSQVLLLPDTIARGVVDQVCENARVLWDEMFPGVPGGADAGRWA